MPHYHALGHLPRKRHTRFRKPDGSLYYEEMMGAEGFSSDQSLLYHEHSPVTLTDVQSWAIPAADRTPSDPVRPRHLRPSDLEQDDYFGTDAVTGRRLVLGNEDVEIYWAAPTDPSPLYRNAMGDELVFVVSGRARVETVFGVLEVGRGDYVQIPGSTTHRWIPLDGDDALRLYIVAASGHIRPPARYLTERGQFGEHSPYCERDLRLPTELLRSNEREVDVYVRHRHGSAVHTYDRHPFDVVGWDGCLYPYAFNILDFEPIVGAIIQPPPTYQTFEGPGFVVCSFVPHKLEWHPEAIPVPYNHANIDSDEVMFYWDGNFGSRGKVSGIEQYSISLHPTGWSHGPHPGAVEAALAAVDSGVDFVSETAVMVDTFRPLSVGEAGLAGDRPDYWSSWVKRPAAR
jgi:homogentisate 1,2-dioxygenase